MWSKGRRTRTRSTQTIPEGWNREKNASGRVSAYVVSLYFWGSREGSKLHKGGNKMQFVYVADQERKQEAIYRLMCKITEKEINSIKR